MAQLIQYFKKIKNNNNKKQINKINLKKKKKKQETKDEPQTNGSYKIRQIIIKIMEYTFTHIRP